MGCNVLDETWMHTLLSAHNFDYFSKITVPSINPSSGQMSSHLFVSAIVMIV